MERKLSQHIDRVADAVSEWLRPDNTELKQAISRTVADGLFSLEDIKHQVLHLKNSLTKKHLGEWALRSALQFNSLEGKKVVCLHAGNLPLVGLQDFLAILLTGGNYIGKVSKKDPYMLPSFFSVCQDHELMEKGRWSTDLKHLEGAGGDMVLFAGSALSTIKVEEKLAQLNILKPGAPKLMRTAHFSVAYIPDNKPATMEALTEAVFRYGGTGCRSVAIVVAPFHLNDEKCSFTDYIESFWLKNPQHEKPDPVLFHRYAYNKAVEIPQAWLNDFLIEEQIAHPSVKFLLYWVKGRKKKLEEIINEFGKGLQTVYSTGELTGKHIGPFVIEELKTAQNPPVWWQPDGVDSIHWLQEQEMLK